MHETRHETLRVPLIVAATVCLALTPSRGQQTAVHKPSVAELVKMLHSEDWTKRSMAYEQLRSNPTALRNPKVQAELINLLDRKSKESNARVHAAQMLLAVLEPRT